MIYQYHEEIIMRKKKILWHSNGPHAPTGFGSQTKYILSYLYKTGKYDIACYAGGAATNDENFKRYPWKSYGSIPLDRQDIVQRANADPGFARLMSYGAVLLNEVVKDFQPDIYIGSEDFWGFSFGLDNKWFEKISSICHWTADSIPLLPEAVEKAPKIKHHLVWAGFAEKEFKRLANELEKKLPNQSEQEQKESKTKIDAWRRVKTLRGCINHDSFFRLPDQQRQELRQKYGFDKDTFIISSGSRSQLRKLFPSQLEGFALFKKQNPGVKAKFIYFSNINEGWDFGHHCKEHDIDPNDVLFAYRCKVTGEIFYLPERKGDFDNPKIQDKGTVRCIGLDNFAPEYVINEFLNLSDVFILCVTSGGQENFLSQAKLTEIPTISNSYSCFEDQVGLEKGTLVVDENFTYEIGTGFRKAAVFPYSICKQFKKVYDMDEKKRREIGRAGKDFVLKTFITEVIGKKWEELLDSLPEYNGPWDLFDEKPANPDKEVPQIQDNTEFVHFLYLELLGWSKETVESNPPDILSWVANLDNGMKREELIGIIRNAARQHNTKLPVTETPEQYLRRFGVSPDAVFLTFKESAGDCVLIQSLFPSLREQYPGRQLVISAEPKFIELFDGNSFIDLVIPYNSFMDNQMLMQGCGANKALVFKCLNVRNGVQANIDYLGDDNINLRLQY